MEKDTVQKDALYFDPDIHRPDTQPAYHTTVVVSIHELFTSPKPESADASNTQEKTTDRDQPDSRHSNSEDPYRPHNFSQQISDHSPEDNFTRQQQADSTVHNIFNRHYTHSESKRIQKEYTEHLLDLTDNQYYSQEYPLDQLQYSILDLDYYGSQPRRSYTQPQDPTGYYPPPPDPADIQHWHTCGREKCALMHGHRLFGEKEKMTDF